MFPKWMGFLKAQKSNLFMFGRRERGAEGGG